MNHRSSASVASASPLAPIARVSRFAGVAALAALASTACSSSSGDDGAPTASETACLDTVEALARAAERCGGDYKANYDAILKSAANGSCKNVIQIRDEIALRATCIPSLQTISCADLKATKVDASCEKQLQRPAGFQPHLVPASSIAGTAGTAGTAD